MRCDFGRCAPQARNKIGVGDLQGGMPLKSIIIGVSSGLSLPHPLCLTKIEVGGGSETVVYLLTADIMFKL